MNNINGTQSISNFSSELTNNLEDDSAIKIQKTWRGFIERDRGLFTAMSKYNAFLPTTFRPSYAALCTEPSLELMDRAQGGKTKVFLPPTLPIAIKECGREKALERLYKMQKVRSILFDSSPLIVPKAALHGKFLIEERLPININPYHNICTYLENLESFDEAVKDMVHLFFNTYISLLLISKISSTGELFFTGVRYDNIPLYLEDGPDGKVGKIGLIDLERIMDPSERSDTYKMCVLATIFPYHADIIIEEALEYCSFDEDEYGREICSIDEDPIHLAAQNGQDIMNRKIAKEMLKLNSSTDPNPATTL